jgi:hypothetical protein
MKHRKNGTLMGRNASELPQTTQRKEGATNGPRSPTRQEADKHDMSAKKNIIMTMNAAISMSVLIEEVDSV